MAAPRTPQIDVTELAKDLREVNEYYYAINLEAIARELNKGDDRRLEPHDVDGLTKAVRELKSSPDAKERAIGNTLEVFVNTHSPR